ncbi:MAG: hypothetical protein CMJ58_00200 [Planctomycetaceae bacterium]|nr:hypothetical protein [Planctomycetaceae bacterium]
MEEIEAEAIERRLARAELTLRLLDEGRFPRLSAFLFGGTTDFRVINDRFPFNDATEPSTVNEQELVASESKFIFRCAHEDGSPRFTVYFEKDLGERELSLAAKSYHSLLAATYAAIGLDMKPADESYAEIPRKERR